jgi:flavin-dependent dehydrogenase
VKRGGDPEAMKKWLLQEYADFPEILGMIKATKAEDILERPVIDRPPIFKWAFGRVLLVGDAVRRKGPLTRVLLPDVKVLIFVDGYASVDGRHTP